MKSILIVGASGFIGSKIARATAQRGGVAVRALTRRKVGSFPGSPVGNLLDIDSLKSALEGVDIIFHAASYVGGDEHAAWSVNVKGTQNLIEAASISGSARTVYVSTTGVYGNGPHYRRQATGTTNPASFRSRTRELAERMVLDAGGAVVRPNLVYGAGDKWVIPAIVRLVRLTGIDHSEFSAPLSIISGDQLAVAIVRFGIDRTANARTIVHGCTRTPTSVSQIMNEISSVLDVTTCPRSVRSIDSAVKQLGMSEHQIRMLTEESTFDSVDFWNPTDNAPSFHLDPSAQEWYRSLPI